MKPVLGAVNYSFIPILHTSFFKVPDDRQVFSFRFCTLGGAG